MVGLKKLLAKILDQLETMLGWNKFSTDEQWTGKYWVDGKKIYRKVFKVTDTSMSSATNISTWNIETPISLVGMSTNSSTNFFMPATYYATSGDCAYPYIALTQKELRHRANTYTTSTYVIEYTKTTD